MEKKRIHNSSALIILILILAGVFSYIAITGKNTLETSVSVETQETQTNCTYPDDWNPRDMWVWGSSVVTNSSERASFFEFATEHRIRNVYVESQSVINNNQTALANFISESKNRCINVELLFGYAPWALTQNHEKAIDLARKSVAFSDSITDKPVGIHFDIEPYLLSEWSVDQNSVANQYLDILEKLSAETSGKLILTVDMPFWFDGRFVTRDGITRTLSEEVINRVDRVAILAYRDSSASITNIANSEMSYAEDVNKKIVVGVETICNLEPEYISFCEEGEAAMEQALDEVTTNYGGRSSFDNFAIHHYRSYKELVLSNTNTPPVVTSSHSPTSEITTGTTVTISATSNEVATIRIFVGGVMQKTCSSTNSCNYASTYAEGTYSYYSDAADPEGSMGVSPTKSFSVATLQTTSSGTLTAPSNLIGKEATPKQIDLTWNDNSDNEEGFIIESSTNLKKVPWSELARVGENVNYYSHTGLEEDRVHYRVKAYNAQAESEYSNEISVRTSSCKFWRRLALVC